MATLYAPHTHVIRSEDTYKPKLKENRQEHGEVLIDVTPISGGSGQESMLNKLVSDIFEYPGSVENHEWYFVKWVASKIEKHSGGGTERG